MIDDTCLKWLQLPEIETVVCDIRDWDATRRTVEELGDIHLLVNNAGVVAHQDALDATPENFDWYVICRFKDKNLSVAQKVSQ